MKGVILSGGKGSRLAPITDDYPKQLLPVLGKPILCHCIDHLRRAAIDSICIILSKETGHIIETELAKFDLGVNISFVYQDEPRGLAHAISLSKEFVGSDDFIVVLGDNLFEEPIMNFREKFESSDSDSLIVLKEVDRPYDFGVVKFDKNGKAEKLVEKPKDFVSNYAIIGVYLFTPKIFDAINKIAPSPRGEYEITDAIALQVEEKCNVQTTILKSYWFDSGTRVGLLDANKTMLLSTNKFDSVDATTRDSYLHGKIALKENALVESSNLMGPIYIGKNSRIFNSTIGPYTTIGDDCIIENSELQDTIVMHGTKMRDSSAISSIIHRDSVISGKAFIINELFAKTIKNLEGVKK